LAATYEIAQQPAVTRRLLQSLRTLVVSQTLLITLITAASLYVICHDEDREIQIAAALALPMVPGLMAQQFALAVLQGQQRFVPLNSYRLAPVVLYSAVMVLLALTSTGTLPIVAAATTAPIVL